MKTFINILNQLLETAHIEDSGFVSINYGVKVDMLGLTSKLGEKVNLGFTFMNNGAFTSASHREIFQVELEDIQPFLANFYSKKTLKINSLMLNQMGYENFNGLIKRYEDFFSLDTIKDLERLTIHNHQVCLHSKSNSILLIWEKSEHLKTSSDALTIDIQELINGKHYLTKVLVPIFDLEKYPLISAHFPKKETKKSKFSILEKNLVERLEKLTSLNVNQQFLNLVNYMCLHDTVNPQTDKKKKLKI